MFYTIWVSLFMIGAKDEVSSFRRFMIRSMGFVCCRFQALLGGLIWVNLEYVEKSEYEKYLGPGFKP